MESLNCPNCTANVSETDNFCPKCGIELKCKFCKAPINKDDIFCSNCGKPLKDTALSNGALNTIKYRKSATEISCEISFTDQVGKERMNDLLSAIVNTQSNTSGNTSESQSNKTLRIGDNDTYDLGNEIEESLNDSFEKDTDSLLHIPHLNDIENKIDCNENVWIGIHAFYVSDQGAKNFDKDMVRNAYMNRRKTVARSKNFATEWKKAHQKFFKTINDKELNFQNGAIDELKTIILNINTKNTSKAKNTNRSAVKKTAGKSVPIEEFELSQRTNPDRPSLEVFLTSKDPGDNTYDKIVVIAYYITRINKIEIFTEGHIEFAYKALQLSERPGHLRQTINNIKNSKVWFKDASQGQWTLERIGEIYVEEKLPHKEGN